MQRELSYNLIAVLHQALSIKQPPAARLGIVEAEWVGAEEAKGFH